MLDQNTDKLFIFLFQQRENAHQSENSCTAPKRQKLDINEAGDGNVFKVPKIQKSGCNRGEVIVRRVETCADTPERNDTRSENKPTSEVTAQENAIEEMDSDETVDEHVLNELKGNAVLEKRELERHGEDEGVENKATSSKEEEPELCFTEIEETIVKSKIAETAFKDTEMKMECQPSTELKECSEVAIDDSENTTSDEKENISSVVAVTPHRPVLVEECEDVMQSPILKEAQKLYDLVKDINKTFDLSERKESVKESPQVDSVVLACKRELYSSEVEKEEKKMCQSIAVQTSPKQSLGSEASDSAQSSQSSIAESDISEGNCSQDSSAIETDGSALSEAQTIVLELFQTDNDSDVTHDDLQCAVGAEMSENREGNESVENLDQTVVANSNIKTNAAIIEGDLTKTLDTTITTNNVVYSEPQLECTGGRKQTSNHETENLTACETIGKVLHKVCDDNADDSEISDNATAISEESSITINKSKETETSESAKINLITSDSVEYDIESNECSDMEDISEIDDEIVGSLDKLDSCDFNEIEQKEDALGKVPDDSKCQQVLALEKTEYVVESESNQKSLEEPMEMSSSSPSITNDALGNKDSPVTIEIAAETMYIESEPGLANDKPLIKDGGCAFDELNEKPDQNEEHLPHHENLSDLIDAASINMNSEKVLDAENVSVSEESSVSVNESTEPDSSEKTNIIASVPVESDIENSDIEDKSLEEAEKIDNSDKVDICGIEEPDHEKDDNKDQIFATTEFIFESLSSQKSVEVPKDTIAPSLSTTNQLLENKQTPTAIEIEAETMAVENNHRLEKHNEHVGDELNEKSDHNEANLAHNGDPADVIEDDARSGMELEEIEDAEDIILVSEKNSVSVNESEKLNISESREINSATSDSVKLVESDIENVSEIGGDFVDSVDKLDKSEIKGIEQEDKTSQISFQDERKECYNYNVLTVEKTDDVSDSKSSQENVNVPTHSLENKGKTLSTEIAAEQMSEERNCKSKKDREMMERINIDDIVADDLNENCYKNEAVDMHLSYMIELTDFMKEDANTFVTVDDISVNGDDSDIDSAEKSRLMLSETVGYDSELPNQEDNLNDVDMTEEMQKTKNDIDKENDKDVIKKSALQRNNDVLNDSMEYEVAKKSDQNCETEISAKVTERLEVQNNENNEAVPVIGQSETSACQESHAPESKSNENEADCELTGHSMEAECVDITPINYIVTTPASVTALNEPETYDKRNTDSQVKHIPNSQDGKEDTVIESEKIVNSTNLNIDLSSTDDSKIVDQMVNISSTIDDGQKFEHGEKVEVSEKDSGTENETESKREAFTKEGAENLDVNNLPQDLGAEYKTDEHNIVENCSQARGLKAETRQIQLEEASKDLRDEKSNFEQAFVNDSFTPDKVMPEPRISENMSTENNHFEKANQCVIGMESADDNDVNKSDIEMENQDFVNEQNRVDMTVMSVTQPFCNSKYQPIEPEREAFEKTNDTQLVFVSETAYDYKLPCTLEEENFDFNSPVKGKECIENIQKSTDEGKCYLISDVSYEEFEPENCMPVETGLEVLAISDCSTDLNIDHKVTNRVDDSKVDGTVYDLCEENVFESNSDQNMLGPCTTLDDIEIKANESTKNHIVSDVNKMGRELEIVRDDIVTDCINKTVAKETTKDLDICKDRQAFDYKDSDDQPSLPGMEYNVSGIKHSLWSKGSQMDTDEEDLRRNRRTRKRKLSDSNEHCETLHELPEKRVCNDAYNYMSSSDEERVKKTKQRRAAEIKKHVLMFMKFRKKYEKSKSRKLFDKRGFELAKNMSMFFNFRERFDKMKAKSFQIIRQDNIERMVKRFFKLRSKNEQFSILSNNTINFQSKVDSHLVSVPYTDQFSMDVESDNHESTCTGKLENSQFGHIEENVQNTIKEKTSRENDIVTSKKEIEETLCNSGCPFQNSEINMEIVDADVPLESENGSAAIAISQVIDKIEQETVPGQLREDENDIQDSNGSHSNTYEDLSENIMDLSVKHIVEDKTVDVLEDHVKSPDGSGNALNDRIVSGSANEIESEENENNKTIGAKSDIEKSVTTIQDEDYERDEIKEVNNDGRVDVQTETVAVQNKTNDVQNETNDIQNEDDMEDNDAILDPDLVGLDEMALFERYGTGRGPSNRKCDIDDEDNATIHVENENAKDGGAKSGIKKMTTIPDEKNATDWIEDLKNDGVKTEPVDIQNEDDMGDYDVMLDPDFVGLDETALFERYGTVRGPSNRKCDYDGEINETINAEKENKEEDGAKTDIKKSVTTIQGEENIRDEIKALKHDSGNDDGLGKSAARSGCEQEQVNERNGFGESNENINDEIDKCFENVLDVNQENFTEVQAKELVEQTESIIETENAIKEANKQNLCSPINTPELGKNTNTGIQENLPKNIEPLSCRFSDSEDDIEGFVSPIIKMPCIDDESESEDDIQCGQREVQSDRINEKLNLDPLVLESSDVDIQCGQRQAPKCIDKRDIELVSQAEVNSGEKENNYIKKKEVIDKSYMVLLDSDIEDSGNESTKDVGDDSDDGEDDDDGDDQEENDDDDSCDDDDDDDDDDDEMSQIIPKPAEENDTEFSPDFDLEFQDNGNDNDEDSNESQNGESDKNADGESDNDNSWLPFPEDDNSLPAATDHDARNNLDIENLDKGDSSDSETLRNPIESVDDPNETEEVPNEDEMVDYDAALDLDLVGMDEAHRFEVYGTVRTPAKRKCDFDDEEMMSPKIARCDSKGMSLASSKGMSETVENTFKSPNVPGPSSRNKNEQVHHREVECHSPVAFSSTQMLCSSQQPDLGDLTLSQMTTVARQLEVKVQDKSQTATTTRRARELLAKLKAKKESIETAAFENDDNADLPLTQEGLSQEAPPAEESGRTEAEIALKKDEEHIKRFVTNTYGP